MTSASVPVVDAGGPVIVGAGLAGLMTAVRYAPRPCTVLAAWEAGTAASTPLAQGGLAAAVGPADDPAQHAADTIAAGAGLCDEDVVAVITAAGPAAVEELLALGAALDRTADGDLDLGLEGAHRRRRVVHARGDGSGAELHRVALAAAGAADSVTIREHTQALQVLVDDHGVAGLLVSTPDGPLVLATRAVVLATGGIGGLFAHTTNPLTSRGQGMALAARADAVVRDPELVQFHPTALDVGLDPMPLVSEAVRGEGALLVTAAGTPVLDDPLSARDVVSRAVWAASRGGEQVYLDARAALGDAFADHFPTIAGHCRAAGIDPGRELVPIRPAVHYAMGGVLVDGDGRTTVPGLWAVGECASTGLHGANRLASNSLLEAVVCSRAVAADLPSGVGLRSVALPRLAAAALERLAVPAPSLAWLRETVESSAGVLRDEAGLLAGLEAVTPWAATDDDALVAALVLRGALGRRESRGGHTRTDHPLTGDPAHTLLTSADVIGADTLLERTAS